MTWQPVFYKKDDMMETLLVKLLRIKARAYTFVLRQCFHTFGKDSVITPPLRFSNMRFIAVGRHVVINGNCWIQTVIENNALPQTPLLTIHDNVSIGMNATISAAKNIILEKHVLLGRNVFISDHGHEFKDVSVPITDQGIRKAMDVLIGEQTWIGHNAVILPGAKIGKHCVIGANSVVNGDIPDYCVAAGAPAKIISRFNGSTGTWNKVDRTE